MVVDKLADTPSHQARYSASKTDLRFFLSKPVSRTVHCRFLHDSIVATRFGQKRWTVSIHICEQGKCSIPRQPGRRPWLLCRQGIKRKHSDFRQLQHSKTVMIVGKLPRPRIDKPLDSLGNETTVRRSIFCLGSLNAPSSLTLSEHGVNKANASDEEASQTARSCRCAQSFPRLVQHVTERGESVGINPDDIITHVEIPRQTCQTSAVFSPPSTSTTSTCAFQASAVATNIDSFRCSLSPCGGRPEYEP